MVVIHLAGLFGWIGMPHTFQVLTRMLQALCRHIISGLCHWYVDDLMAIFQQLLGQGSIAATTAQVDRCLEFLGWTFTVTKSNKIQWNSSQ